MCQAEKHTHINVPCLQGQWHMEDPHIRMTVFIILSEPVNVLQSNVFCWCISVSRDVLWNDWIAEFKAKARINVHRYDIFSVAELLLTKPGTLCIMVRYRREPEWHTKILICYLQGQCHNDGSYNQNKTVQNVEVEHVKEEQYSSLMCSTSTFWTLYVYFTKRQKFTIVYPNVMTLRNVISVP